MSDTANKQKDADASYQLTYEPDGTSCIVRENLVDILERELLGPIHGPDEVLPFSPRSQYLVGLIAPVKLTGGKAATDHDDESRQRAWAISSRHVPTATEGRGVPAAGVPMRLRPRLKSDDRR